MGETRLARIVQRHLQPERAAAQRKGFQVNCGIRIRGGFSRDPNNPKHSWRIFFRREYGDAKLVYPIFQTEGVDEFDAFDIQTSQNYSWAYQNNGQNNLPPRTLVARHPAGQVGYNPRPFYHLYLNGQYWGLFQSRSAPRTRSPRSYLGGNNDNMDVIKATGDSGSYQTEATDGYLFDNPDGSLSAWRRLYDLTRACFYINTDRDPLPPNAAHVYTVTEKNAAFFKIFGLAADGKTPTGDQVLLDLDNHIDYMLTVFFSGNTDSPLSHFLGDDQPNNFHSMRDRTQSARGFMSSSGMRAHDGCGGRAPALRR